MKETTRLERGDEAAATARNINQFLMTRLKSRPKDFLDCLKKETEHMGHAYIAALIEKREYCSPSVKAESAKLKKRILSHQSALMDVDVQVLKPYLIKEQLITSIEIEEMDSKSSRVEKNLFLLNVVLENKGPTAHILFTNCLGEEKSHPMHQILYRKLLMEEKQTRKRPASGTSKSLAKRLLTPLEMERPLKGKVYSRIMRAFQTYHHTSDWDALEGEAQPYLDGSRGNVHLQAAALLEMAISYTFRGQNNFVDRFVQRARSLLHKVTGNNQNFLEGRCEHVLSCRYRYSKELDKAREHTHRAKVVLFGSEAGEDSSWAHYCDACVLMEEYTQNSEMTESNLMRLKESFQLAIDHARRHDTGMEVVEPHSHIRFVQLCMGSTQFTAGTNCSPEMLQEAQQHLDAVNVPVLKQRSQSLYYIFKSDLTLNFGHKHQALEYARKALVLGSPSYTVEIKSAQQRIKALTTEC